MPFFFGRTSPTGTECAPLVRPRSPDFPMPIRHSQPDMFPADLLADDRVDGDWAAFYLLARREKDFMRRLRAMQIAHYGPTLVKRYRSPGGRMRESQIPLFSGYVFVRGTKDDFSRAMTTNCVSRRIDVADSALLIADLHQIRRLILLKAPLTPEARLQPGQWVRVRNGPFAGLEGTILKRHGETRLVVAVRFLQQGASILLEDCEVEPA